MTSTHHASSDFRAKLRARKPMHGVFVKIPHPHIIEVLATTAVNFIVLDAEHAPFGPPELDRCIAAARAADIPCLVRVPAHSPHDINAALDMGATGIIVPHISSKTAADAAVQAAIYRNGSRGISMAHRAGGYGQYDFNTYIQAADKKTVIIAQIEDAAALDALPAILTQERIDAFFIGRADLALSLGASDAYSEIVNEAIVTITTALNDAKRTFGTYVTDPLTVEKLSDDGYSLFALGSDQDHLATAVRNALAQGLIP